MGTRRAHWARGTPVRVDIGRRSEDDSAEGIFAAVAEEMAAADERVTSPATERRDGHRFGAAGLKVGGKIFVMVSNGQVVFKLPKARVAELAAGGVGTPFDPGHGRLMKEWIGIDPRVEADWRRLASEALAFVGGARAP
jgi:hypothetical protein